MNLLISYSFSLEFCTLSPDSYMTMSDWSISSPMLQVDRIEMVRPIETGPAYFVQSLEKGTTVKARMYSTPGTDCY